MISRKYLNIIISKLLLGLYIFSLAFFDKAILFGYDSLTLYVAVLIFLFILKKSLNILIPRAIFVWLIFLVVLLLSSIAAFSLAKIMTSALRYIAVLICSISLYNLLIYYDDGISDALNYYIILAISLSLLGILQVIEFNFLHSFNLYFPPTNLTFIRSGGPGAVTKSGIVIFRATGTFAEPSWLAYFLFPALTLMIIRFLQHSNMYNLLSAIIIFIGLLCSFSFNSIVILSIMFLLLLFIKLLCPLYFLKMPDKQTILSLLFGIVIVLIVVAFIASCFPVARIYLTSRLQEVVSGTDVSASMRKDTAKQALELFKSFPILGVGIGNYQYVSSILLGGPADISINSGYLLILSELGLIGILVFIMILIYEYIITLNIRHNLELRDQLIWLLMSHVLLLISYNWWHHFLLWFHLVIPLAAKKIAMKNNRIGGQ